jgi:hypothetical protein
MMVDNATRERVNVIRYGRQQSELYEQLAPSVGQDHLVPRLAQWPQIIMGTTKTTTYLEEHQVVFFDLLDEVNKAGAIRSALDDWIEDQDVDVTLKELKLATANVRQSSQSVEDLVEECDGVEEFVNKAEEITTAQPP